MRRDITITKAQGALESTLGAVLAVNRTGDQQKIFKAVSIAIVTRSNKTHRHKP